MSPRHARIACRAGTYTLRDLDSVNGVYVRLRDRWSCATAIWS